METAETPDPANAAAETSRPPLVDWGRTARRMRAMLLVIAGIVVLAWLVTGAFGAGFAPQRLAELAGFGVLAAFAAEVVVVGGSALRGLLHAGERGERLSGDDVALLPPQARRRRRR